MSILRSLMGPAVPAGHSIVMLIASNSNSDQSRRDNKDNFDPTIIDHCCSFDWKNFCWSNVVA
jgi:hypothetical protein